MNHSEIRRSEDAHLQRLQVESMRSRLSMMKRTFTRSTLTHGNSLNLVQSCAKLTFSFLLAAFFVANALSPYETIVSAFSIGANRITFS